MSALLAQMTIWTLSLGMSDQVREDCQCLIEVATSEDSGKLVDVAQLEQLAEAFNADKGYTRLIVLFSPTCPGCIEGAQVTQRWLDENRDAKIRVYAVWLPMLPGDKRAVWKAEELSDPRVRHYWDPDAKVVGR